MRIDLHSHTTASDGALSPTALVERAAGLGVEVLAVTDHDTVAGIAEAKAAGERVGVRVLDGIEISATLDGRSIHLLGYLFDPASPALFEPVGRLVEGRDGRNRRLAARLTALGMPIDFDEVAATADGTLGRPHFAAMMIAKGYVATKDEAFERWLGHGRPAYLDKEVLTPKQAIDALHAAGGVAVLAHPMAYARDPVSAERLIRALAADGLDGVEVYYGHHTPGETSMVRCFVDRFGLLATGGSDFHEEPGAALPVMPEGTLEALLARAA